MSGFTSLWRDLEPEPRPLTPVTLARKAATMVSNSTRPTMAGSEGVVRIIFGSLEQFQQTPDGALRIENVNNEGDEG